MNYRAPTLILSLFLLSLAPPAVQASENIIIPSIPPGNFLYPLKLAVENIQEMLVFDSTKKALLMQEHLRNRIDELNYEIYLDGNRYTANILQDILKKKLQIAQHLESTRLIDDSALVSQDKQNTEVLNNLLNNPGMPNASRKGLNNAINQSGMKILTANMAQGNYRVSSSIVSMLPFRTAMIFEPKERTWYSVIINKDSVSISTNPISQPDITLYPTESQMSEFTDIAGSINNNGLSWNDVGRLMKLWYSIPRKGGN